jgi:RNA polymerase sigma-70 factor (ECF subfamily)
MIRSSGSSRWLAAQPPGERGYVIVEEKRAFRNALEQVRAGSPEAVWSFIETYGPHIQRIVRRRLDQRMRSQFDSLDFVQMVWMSFFRNPGEIRSFQQPEDLVRFLAAVARRKVIDQYRRRVVASKCSVTREQSIQEVPEPRDGAEMTPSRIAIAREQWELLLRRQPARDRSIAQLRFGGATYTEISQQLGIHERTARRVIDRLTRESRERS